MRDAARFGEDVLGKDPRQLVLANHHLHVDAKVAGRAEYFDHAAYGRARRRGPTGDFDIDNQALLRAFRFWTRVLLRSRARDAAWRRRQGFRRREE